MNNQKLKIAVVYSHHKLGDLIWQLPYIKSISEHFLSPVTLIVRSKTQAKDILQDEKFINNFFYCEFRKKIWYFFEIFKLYKFFKNNSFSHVFLLDKISRPAIAAKIANVKNIIGPGIKNQKKWISNKKVLSDLDYQTLDYSEQSKKFLNMNNIKVSNYIPELNLKNETFKNIQPELKNQKNIVSFGVDSFELYKMWFEDQFVELANSLYDEGLVTKIYLIAGKNNKKVVNKIIKLSKKNIFYDCSEFNLLEITKVIKNSYFFVGNNSGPLNLASALKVKAFGLIANAKISELKNTNIIPITPPNYKNEFNKDRDEMRKLKASEVYKIIKKNLF